MNIPTTFNTGVLQYGQVTGVNDTASLSSMSLTLISASQLPVVGAALPVSMDPSTTNPLDQYVNTMYDPTKNSTNTDASNKTGDNKASTALLSNGAFQIPYTGIVSVINNFDEKNTNIYNIPYSNTFPQNSLLIYSDDKKYIFPYIHQATPAELNTSVGRFSSSVLPLGPTIVSKVTQDQHNYNTDLTVGSPGHITNKPVIYDTGITADDYVKQYNLVYAILYAFTNYGNNLNFVPTYDDYVKYIQIDISNTPLATKFGKNAQGIAIDGNGNPITDPTLIMYYKYYITIQNRFNPNNPGTTLGFAYIFKSLYDIRSYILNYQNKGIKPDPKNVSPALFKMMLNPGQIPEIIADTDISLDIPVPSCFNFNYTLTDPVYSTLKCSGVDARSALFLPVNTYFPPPPAPPPKANEEKSLPQQM